MTVKVRWVVPPSPAPVEYETLDDSTGQWVPCGREDVDRWLKEGHTVHMNPL